MRIEHGDWVGTLKNVPSNLEPLMRTLSLDILKKQGVWMEGHPHCWPYRGTPPLHTHFEILDPIPLPSSSGAPGGLTPNPQELYCYPKALKASLSKREVPGEGSSGLKFFFWALLGLPLQGPFPSGRLFFILSMFISLLASAA